jgi:hypothetical protein
MPKQTFEVGDFVWVHDDEGLDVPNEARGKFGRVAGKLGCEANREYWVEGPDFPTFNAASYHIVKLPSVRMHDNPKNIMGILHTSDPDLHERVHEISTNHYRLRDFSDATTCFVLLWLGVQALDDNPRLLEGSGLHEVI